MRVLVSIPFRQSNINDAVIYSIQADPLRFEKYPRHVINAFFYQFSYEMSNRHSHYLFKKSARRKKLPLEYYFFLLRHLVESHLPLIKHQNGLRIDEEVSGQRDYSNYG